jgi:formylglycine-generating enzyme required for sulfatase activity
MRGQGVAYRAAIAALPLLLVTGAVAGQPSHRPVVADHQPQLIRTKTGIAMVLVPAGSFKMGSNRGSADEAPVHRVSVEAFYMDAYEVTQQRYGELVRGNPSHFKGPKNPVEQVSWPLAALYCNARSRAEGLQPCYREDTAECNYQASGYRLPTEAEWEYACRAGADTSYCFGDDARKLGDYGWYAGNSADTTHPAGRKKPNRWGLYDLYGNVAEWCNDRYDPRYYEHSPGKAPRGPVKSDKIVLRGGAWNSTAEECRSAHRLCENPGFQVPCFRGDHIGFRCVRRAR